MNIKNLFAAVLCAAALSLTACGDGGNSTASVQEPLIASVEEQSGADVIGSSSAAVESSAANAAANSSAGERNSAPNVIESSSAEEQVGASDIESTPADEPDGVPETSESSASPLPEPAPDPEKDTVLVAYFSCTGNTKKLAEYAAEITDGTLYEITPAVPYTSADLDYGDRNSRSTKEMDDPDCRPEISGSVDNFDDYEIVFIAYPIWWGEAPRIISTFVESYDFSGKTVVPFCTSGSSGIGSSAKNLHVLTDGANWLDGARHKSSMSMDEMSVWINGLGIDL